MAELFSIRAMRGAVGSIRTNWRVLVEEDVEKVEERVESGGLNQ